MHDISVVIPFYNDAESCIQLVDYYQHTFKQLNLKFEFVITDDFSKKESSLELNNAFKDNSTVKVFHFKKNIGQYGSLAYGISKASGKLVLITDQDILGVPKEDIAKLISNSSQFDLQYIFQDQNQRSLTRKLFSSLWHLFILLNTRKKGVLENPLPFRLVRNDLIEKLIANNYTITTLDIALLKHSKQRYFYKIDDSQQVVIKSKSEYSLSMLIKIGIYSVISIITDLKLLYIITSFAFALSFGILYQSLTYPVIILLVAIIIFGLAILITKEQSFKQQIKQIECIEQ